MTVLSCPVASAMEYPAGRRVSRSNAKETAMATPGYHGVRTVVFGLVAFAAMGGAGRAAPPDKGPAATRVVYVLSNNPIPGQNAILAYRSNAVDGSLTPL